MLARKRRLRSVKRKEIFGCTNDLRHFLAETVLLAFSSCLELLKLLESDYKCSRKKEVNLLYPDVAPTISSIFESG